jgi:hypothetical protein
VTCGAFFPFSADKNSLRLFFLGLVHIINMNQAIKRAMDGPVLITNICKLVVIKAYLACVALPASYAVA